VPSTGLAAIPAEAASGRPRTVSSAIAERAVADGHASRADLERISQGWRAWGAAPDGWYAVLHGEILCRV
jgi:hypothetical protein